MSGCIDAGLRQTLQMPFTRLGIDDVYRLFPAGQTLPDEGKQYAIFFLVVREKCANVTNLAELRARERNWLQRLCQLQFLPLEVASRRVGLTSVREYPAHKVSLISDFTTNRS
jgi:hypothetical protein